MGKNILRTSILTMPRAIGEFGLGFGANIGHIALSEVRDRINPNPTSLTANVMNNIDLLLIPGDPGITKGMRQVKALKATHIASELQVAESGVRAAHHDKKLAEQIRKKPARLHTPKDEAALERDAVADKLTRHSILFAGTLVAKGLLPDIAETEEFPYRTTDDDVEGFIEVADLAYQGVKARETIDPPLLPVGFEPTIFNTLHIATQHKFHPEKTILL